LPPQRVKTVIISSGAPPPLAAARERLRWNNNKIKPATLDARLHTHELYAAQVLALREMIRAAELVWQCASGLRFLFAINHQA
jgi:hypothetical protein